MMHSDKKNYALQIGQKNSFVHQLTRNKTLYYLWRDLSKFND